MIELMSTSTVTVPTQRLYRECFMWPLCDICSLQSAFVKSWDHDNLGACQVDYNDSKGIKKP